MRFAYTFLLIFFTGASSLQAQEPPPAMVVTANITREAVSENQSFIGLLEFDKTSNVSADVSGLVEEIFIKESQNVKKGDILVQLDTEILDQEIALKKNEIKQDQLAIELAEKNLHRLKELLEKMGTSEKNYDDALFAFQDAQLEKQSAEIELEQLLTKKRKSGIIAPFDGMVLNKNIEVGDWVQQGKQLMEIASLEDIIVRVPVDESLLRYIHPGAQIPLTINALNREETGTVLRIHPIADVRTKNVFVKVGITAFEGMIANMSATAFIPTSEEKELSIIPRDALIKFQGKDFVYTIKDGKASILPIHIVTYLGNKIGADNPYFTEGMPVIIEGNERLQPDQPVTTGGGN